MDGAVVQRFDVHKKPRIPVVEAPVHGLRKLAGQADSVFEEDLLRDLTRIYQFSADEGLQH
jgi:hypothetical protein